MLKSCNNCYFFLRLETEDPCDICYDPDLINWKPVDYIPEPLSPKEAVAKMQDIINKIMG